MTINEFIERNKAHLDILCRLENYTLEHSWDVLKLSYELGKKAELSEGDMENLLLGTVFHDVGKSLIPQDILNKPGKLTDEEFDIIIGFDYKEEQSVTISQSHVGGAVNVEVLDEFGNIDYDFKIPQKDFIRMLDEYQKNNNII